LDEEQAADIEQFALAPIERQQGENPYEIQHELQDVMQDLVGIARVDDELEQAVDRIAGLRARAEQAASPGNREYNPGWHTALDLWNLLDVSEAVARSAHGRRESRGAHSRIDFMEKDPQLGTVNTLTTLDQDGSVSTRHVPVTGKTDDLESIVKEMG
ncbi:MAG: fumarate reductase/succinate dehydrogenase flavoprotein subunit, partial [Phycisphaerae bacterium]|nr:fumarate reductase/succinate dehydrogenase flavoprotein subunit [Phycisphaerae bacterium]